MVNRYVTKLEHEVFIDCHPLCGGRNHAMVNSYQPFPYEHAHSAWFRWIIDFCNKYVISLWLMLSPWIIRTLTFPPLLASLVPGNFRPYHTPTIYLPQNSHHTYLLWHFHRHSEIYFHATFHRSVHHQDIHYFCHIVLICMRHLYRVISLF